MSFVMHFCQSLIIFVLLSTASSLPWDGPEPTAVHNGLLLRAEDWSPAPTPKPQAFFQQWKRQGSGSSTSLDPSTCGYISGSTSNYLTCEAENPGNACVYDAQYSAWGCCQTPYTACQLATSCIPYSDLSSCGSDCSADPYLTICSSSAIPLCNEYVLDDNGVLAYAFWCDSTTEIDTVSLFATDGDQGFATFVEVTMTILEKTSTSTTPSSTTPSSTPSSTKPTSSSPPSTSILTTPSLSSTPIQTPSPSSTPVGAIAGGTVGGIAVIGAIIVAIVFILRHNRKPKSSPALAPTHYPASYSPTLSAPELYSSPVPSYTNRSSTFKPAVGVSEPMRAMPMFPAGGQGLGVGVTELEHGNGVGGGGGHGGEQRYQAFMG